MVNNINNIPSSSSSSSSAPPGSSSPTQESRGIFSRVWGAVTTVSSAVVGTASWAGSYTADLAIASACRNIDANIADAHSWLAERLDQSDMSVIEDQIGKLSPKILEFLPGSLKNNEHPEKIARYLILVMVGNMVANAKILPRAPWDTSVPQQSRLGLAAARTLDTIAGNLQRTEETYDQRLLDQNVSKRKIDQSGIGFDFGLKYERYPVVDAVLDVFLTSPESGMTSSGLHSLLKLTVPFFTTAKVNDFIGDYLRGFISAPNDVSAVAPIANEVVNELTATLGNKYLTDLTPLFAPITEGLQDNYRHVLNGVADSLGLDKSPHLVHYLMGKQRPILQNVVNSLLEVGKNIQQYDPSYAGLDDHALILLGATSVATYFESTRGSQTNPQAFVHLFPQFIGVNIPPQLRDSLIGFVSEKLSFFSHVQNEAPAREARLLELYPQSHNADGAATSSARPAILETVDQITDIAFLSVRGQVSEMNSGSIAESLTQVLHENGFKIPEVQLQELLTHLTHSNDAAIQPLWNGVRSYLRSVVEELFIRLATNEPGTDKAKIFMEMMIQRVSAQVLSQQNPNLTIAEKQELTEQFYRNVVNDVLALLDISGPESLTMIPPFLREVVFEQLRGPVLPNVLNVKFAEIRKNSGLQFLTFLENQLRRLYSPDRVVVAQGSSAPSVPHFSDWTNDSLNDVVGLLTEVLELSPNLNPGPHALGEMAAGAFGLVGPNQEAVPGAVALANLAGQTLVGTPAADWVRELPQQRVTRLESELTKWDSERERLEALPDTPKREAALQFANQKIIDTRALLQQAIMDQMNFADREAQEILATIERVEAAIPKAAKAAIKDSIKSRWHSSQERMDASIERRFGQRGKKAKEAVDSLGRRAVINPMRRLLRGTGTKVADVAARAARGYVQKRVDRLYAFFIGNESGF